MPRRTAYEIHNGAVSATGFVVDASEIKKIAGSVQAILRDDQGLQQALAALATLTQTDFEQERLSRILSAPGSFSEWRVGEALGEHHLVTEVGCEFPWPYSRSTRNPKGSEGGVDLVGFHSGDRVRFVFAEVKTSHQQAWPPAVVTSRSHGLHKQLSGLNMGDERREWAIKYLCMNATHRPWIETLKNALHSYMRDRRDVAIYGILVHATEPNEADLKSRAATLASAVQHPTSLTLFAIYLTRELLLEVANAEVLLETGQ